MGPMPVTDGRLIELIAYGIISHRLRKYVAKSHRGHQVRQSSSVGQELVDLVVACEMELGVCSSSLTLES